MNDNEVIKRGVELAPGWSMVGDVIFYPGSAIHGKGTSIYNMHKIYLAALAAALADEVRRVAKERKQPWLWTNMRKAVMGTSLDDDLRMNTIRAIVESGVLEVITT